VEWFRSRREAKIVIEVARQHYNQVRPHSGLAYRTPVEFRRDHESIQPGAILNLQLVRKSGARTCTLKQDSVDGINQDEL
jgi:hypothetical protein